VVPDRGVGAGGEARCPLRGTSQFGGFLRTVEQRRRLRTEEGARGWSSQKQSSEFKKPIFIVVFR
jgi:hypothetical protein